MQEDIDMVVTDGILNNTVRSSKLDPLYKSVLQRQSSTRLLFEIFPFLMAKILL